MILPQTWGMEGLIPSDIHSPGSEAQTLTDIPSGPAHSGKRMGTRPEIVGVSLSSGDCGIL